LHLVSCLLQQLGAEVRRIREAKSLTIRALSERAAISPRFVALLEKGEANISVERLHDVAEALGTSASALLARGEAPEAAAAPAHMVALLGLRGAGKSAIGRRAAARLSVPFIEVDALIAERAGLELSAIFALHGADYYRRLETAVIDELCARPRPAIVATGGGVVTNHAAFERLQRGATTVFLKASAQDHWNRVVAQGDVRPMANRADATRELRAILRARRALYERAHHTVDTTALGLDRSVDRVATLASTTA
jgi:XRE family transcriptional regulator, aerobic/anaerobic benzoate catabolism transcriptional regulator